MVLSNAELASMRATSAQNLPDTCLIRRFSGQDDGVADPRDGWTDDPSAVPCRVANAGVAAESSEGARVVEVQHWTATLAHDVRVGPKDKITWTETTSGQVRDLQVVGPGGRSRPTSYVVECVGVDQ